MLAYDLVRMMPVIYKFHYSAYTQVYVHMVAARLGCRSLSWHWVGKLSPWLHVENATLTLNVGHSWLFRL